MAQEQDFLSKMSCRNMTPTQSKCLPKRLRMVSLLALENTRKLVDAIIHAALAMLVTEFTTLVQSKIPRNIVYGFPDDDP